MTSEIGILNKHGIVLAADSAVTISFGQGQSKTYNAVNKLFSLGYNHNIGFMIYGNAEFMSIPWEILFKEFRNECRDINFHSVTECSQKFLDYIINLHHVKSNLGHNLIVNSIHLLLQKILDESSNLVNERFANSESHQIEDSEILNIIKSIIRKGISEEHLELITISRENFDKNFKQICTDILRSNIVIQIDDEIIELFVELAYLITKSKNHFDNPSGIVIGGYGSDDLFPSLLSFEISYLYDSNLKIERISNVSIGLDSEQPNASIIPFAQSDMISTIMTGMDPILSKVIVESLTQFGNLSNDSLSAIMNQIGNEQHRLFIEPILSIVRTLSLPELANMAQTLVNLTSFKRHITDSLETVGGPVDVLVISKGDGPIWIERKEYFDVSKNLEYSKRKMR